MIWFDWWQKLCWAGKPKKKQNSRRGVCLFLRPFFVWRSSPSLNRCWLPNKKLPFLKGRQNFCLGVTDLPEIEQKKRKARHNPNCFAERVGQRKICQTFFYKVKLGSRSNWLKTFRSWLGRKKNVVRMHLSRFCFPTKVGFGNGTKPDREVSVVPIFRFGEKRNPGNQKQLQSQLLLFFNHFFSAEAYLGTIWISHDSS